MTWKLNNKEFESVLALSDERRYAYFVKRVADRAEIWSLWQGDGWLLYGDDEGNELVPVWPHPQFAEACATGVWQGAIARSIDIHEWLEHWIPGMSRDHRYVAVFPISSNRGTKVPPERLKEDLEEELTLIE